MFSESLVFQMFADAFSFSPTLESVKGKIEEDVFSNDMAPLHISGKD